jgi:hypothetical protein
VVNTVVYLLLLLYNIKNLTESTLTALFGPTTRLVFASAWDKLLAKSVFIPTFYTRNENIWQDGFLLDFLQKKTADAWVRRFVIYTGFLFSERLVFDSVVRIYLDNLIWPGHDKSIFETSNVSEMLTSIIFILVTLWFTLFTVYLFTVL